MVERTLIFIIAVVFFGASWWWSNRQHATEDFYEAQLRVRDAAIGQLCALALPQVQGKTPEQVQALFTNLYPAQQVRLEDNAVYAGDLGVRFSEEKKAAGLFLPWGAIK
jgi:hypothetical protein